MGDHVELAHLGLLLLLSLDGGHTGGLGKLLTQEDVDFIPSVIRKLCLPLRRLPLWAGALLASVAMPASRNGCCSG